MVRQKTLSRRRPVWLGMPLLFIAAAVMTVPSAALTTLEGDYQLIVDARKENRSYEWDFDANHDETWTGLQFRLFSAPFPNTEVFARFEADWNRNGNSGRRPYFQYRESHLRYRWDRGSYGSDIYLFQRQDRYWVENYLIPVIYTGNLTDSGNSQGVRLDLWGWGDTRATYILSDYSGQSNPGAGSEVDNPTDTDDAHIVRIRREFFGRRLRLGMTYNRKVLSATATETAHVGVAAWDMRYSFLNTDLYLEYADSYSKNIADHQEGSFELGGFRLDRGDYWLPSDAIVKGELRTLRVGSASLGYYNVMPTFWYYGRDFVNPLGFGNRDQQGVWINSWYLVPQRAITMTLNYTSHQSRVFNQRHYTELYAEMYTEYVNGFTSKLYYADRKYRDQVDPTTRQITNNRDLFLEVQVESRLAWMRVQAKIKDVDTARRKELASLESTINITDKLKLYGRYTFADDPARLRKGLFAQIQYRPRGNMDVFLEYGPGWIGDNPNPVDDGDLEGGADNQNLIKLIVRGNF